MFFRSNLTDENCQNLKTKNTIPFVWMENYFSRWKATNTTTTNKLNRKSLSFPSCMSIVYCAVPIAKTIPKVSEFLVSKFELEMEIVKIR